MWKTSEGSTGRLIQLCLAYFFFYVITGVTVKYFQSYPGGPMMVPIEYLVYSTLGGVSVALAVVIIRKWYKFKTAIPKKIGPFTVPGEFFYIIPSGFCTAIIITFTTLMYSIKGVSVMVAMVIMRGSVIVISRIVDSIQIRQGILHKKVYKEENYGVFFALLAISVKLFWSVFTKKSGDFDFFTHPAAMSILCGYIAAYALRIYIMNYFKNTRPKGIKGDNRGYFAIEQISATTFILIAAFALFYWPINWGGGIALLEHYRSAVTFSIPSGGWAILAGTAFGLVSFFSVFIFMFKGRTATFAGLVNRLTSLLAGTAATIISWMFLTGKFPELQDWLSLFFIVVAIGFMTVAEKRRARELLAAHEIEDDSDKLTQKA